MISAGAGRLDYFRRLQPEQLAAGSHQCGGDGLPANLGRDEFTGRDVGRGQPNPVALDDDACDVIVAAGIEHGRLVDRPGRDDPGHVALDQIPFPW